MDYRETDPAKVAQFLSEWDHYKTVNGMWDAPPAVLFHSFRAAWAWFTPTKSHIAPDLDPVPAELGMLRDWLAVGASGYWEPVDA